MISKNIIKIITKQHFSRRFINTQIIKQYQNQLDKIKTNSNNQIAGPLTLQQQIQIINSPKMIKHLEIIQYGIKLPKHNNWNALSLLLIVAFLYYNYQIFPITIKQRYLCISTETSNYPVGYLGSFFTFSNTNIYFYLPIFLVVHHSTRYIKYFSPLLIPIFLINSYIGKMLIQKDLQKFQVWNRQKITYGQGFLHSIGFALWSFFGFKAGLGDAFRSRIFIKAIPGLGIINPGIPIGYIMSAYVFYEIYRYISKIYNNKKISGGRSQLILSSIIWGLFYGLVLRRMGIKMRK